MQHSVGARETLNTVELKYLVLMIKNWALVPSFLSWIRTLYKCPPAFVLTNSHFSEYIN